MRLTSGRTITRDQVREACREALISELESNEKINGLREAAAEKASREDFAARSSGTGLTDRNSHYLVFG